MWPAWRESSMRFFSGSISSGKTVPSLFLHKQLDVTRAGTIFQPARQKCMLRPAEEIKLEIRSESTIANWDRFPRLAMEVGLIYAWLTDLSEKNYRSHGVDVSCCAAYTCPGRAAEHGREDGRAVL